MSHLTSFTDIRLTYRTLNFLLWALFCVCLCVWKVLKANFLWATKRRSKRC